MPTETGNSSAIPSGLPLLQATSEIYKGIKTALGPTLSKTALLKTTSREVITDKSGQMDRWVKHYSELYSRENTVPISALDAISTLPIMEELDAEPTL